MKQSILILLLGILTISFFPCNGQNYKNSFIIRGNLTGLKSKHVYFEGQRGNSLYVDSVIAKDGEFEFKGSTLKPYYACIYTNNDRKAGWFFVQNGNISITGNNDSLNKIKVTGSPVQDEYEAFKNSIKILTDQQNIAYQKAEQAQIKKDTATFYSFVRQASGLHMQVLEKDKNYIASHPKSFVSALLLPELRILLNYEGLNELYTGLDTLVQDAVDKGFYEKYIYALSKTAIGKPALLFTQNNMSGKPISLADYKGKFVLIDFWASWCGPCRTENPNVVKAYGKYKNKGFTVLGISLDQNGEEWKKAVVHDKLTWEQVSDLKSWKNEVALQYHVMQIPSNFLIDPTGTIIAHDLYGDELKHKLAEVIK